MQWKGRRGSRNIEDRRRAGGGMRAGGAAGVGGIGLVAVFVIALLLGVDPAQLLNQIEPGAGSSGAPVGITAEDEAAGEFVSVVLADTEEIWTRLFADQLNRRYTPATLVLFKDGTQSPCGGASGATGPFYCPADRKVYLDTGFFVTMEHQLGAKGDFAAAYVVAHEIGHHVQNELGILSKANSVRQQVSEVESNRISVMIELQADCLSGIWAREAAQSLGVVERGDFEEALNAARRIGDDTLQRNAGRRPMPHTFTHGTSEQRERWFETGLRSGKIAACDTFSADAL
ncbi:KPN_02809 family neutral zinc metallopeptidase [Pseudogemmobacter humi]|uniref:Neutral zinc metallopeptidase n=1 Tax=Pseudogemmobacter humi TaxID=2483812 RepID=A0A3P5X747_9RHOB|nr:neutral zinc metallopeptidase [Pseudogemmobacter humi]VDC30203.1 Putative neutral zinc metallopeptidase [Pseudogemmobacter humi]